MTKSETSVCSIKQGGAFIFRVAARAQLFESAGSLKQVSSGRQAKAMYSCKAEHSHELSFPQGAIFSNGKICFTLTYIKKEPIKN